MKCLQCKKENPQEVKFCVECGNKLELLCPTCGFSNSPSYKFCGDCGHKLVLPSAPPRKELSFNEKLEKIQKYLPSGITEKILSQRDRIEGEKRQVTVMFCDMKGFTPLSEKLGPETMYAMMDEVYEILIHKVHDYEGTVNEMTGDGVMALFGTPIALEDAPQRAIRSGMAIHREISRYNEKVKREKGDIPPIQMRIGIHTGPAVVGTLGNDLRVEFKAVGDTVNLASRIESLAEPGTTYISEDTFKATEGLFRVEALGEKEIKGKEKPLRVYQVIAPSTRRTRFDVSAERGLTPFVGRQRGLGLLMDGYERSEEGRGQAISIISEAGIGKSRLLYEFRKAVTTEDVTFMEGKCISYSRDVAYHPIVDILKANFDIQDDDTDQQVRQKVTNFLKITHMDEPSTLPYLLELLSVKESGIEKIQMSPEARKDRTLEALKRITLKGSELRPLIMAVEDLHWMDRSSEDAFKELLESISGSRVLLIFTYRPEFVHTWGSRSYHSQVTLNKLSNRESLAMVSHLLNTTNVDKDIEELTLSKTEGIPFFIEEFIKSLREMKIIEKSNGTYKLTRDLKAIAIPSTIQDVIMARVDHLPEGAREVLRTGSIIEREFSHELIQKVTGLPEQQLLSDLSTLRDSELLYERGIYPNITYIFKHALTREVVYDTMLTKRKKKLHEEIGNAIEKLHKNNLSEHYVVLAEHYFLSENYVKVVEYSKLASRKAEKAALINDAIAQTRKRITSLERLPQTEDVQRKVIDSRTALGLYGIQMNYHDEAQEAIGPIIDLAVKLDYKRRLCQIYTVLGANYLFVEDDCLKALKVLEEALQISEEVNDAVTAIFASYWFGVALSCNCEFEKSAHYIQKALDINMAFTILWGIAAIKSDMSYFIYYLPGKIDLAYQTSREAVRIAEECGDILAKAFSYPLHGGSCYGKGFLEDAEKHLLKALEFTERVNHHLRNGITHIFLGEIYFEMGDFPRSKGHYERGSRILENDRILPTWVSVGKIGFARSKVLNKEKDVDLETLYVHTRNTQLKIHKGEIHRDIGEILLNIDDKHMPEAEKWIQKAIEIDYENGMNFSLGKDYALHADLSNRKGDRLKAQENLGKAVSIFKECGANGWVTRTEQTLAGLL
jgi:class 3 adenylate cyclase/tetratricopeptide (TPR) repeat protein